MGLKHLAFLLSIFNKVVSFTLHIIHLLEVLEVISQTSDDLSLIATGLRFLLLLTRLIHIYIISSHLPLPMSSSLSRDSLGHGKCRASHKCPIDT